MAGQPEQLTQAELIAQLTQLGEDLSNPQDLLSEFASDRVEEMKRLAPVDNGDLRNSIGYQIEGSNITFRMLQYGYYQNYGVLPNQFTNNPKQFAGGQLRAPWAEPDFGVTMGRGYQLPRTFGMMARPFYSLEAINNEIIDGIAEFTANF